MMDWNGLTVPNRSAVQGDAFRNIRDHTYFYTYGWIYRPYIILPLAQDNDKICTDP